MTMPSMLKQFGLLPPETV